jgi:thiamine-monophosphate kinase
LIRELAVIDLIGQLTQRPEYLADDAFLDPQTRQIYTTDMLVEGRHFRMDYFSPEDLGWKAAAVNISDIAAMGGRLKYLLISLGLPEDCDDAWIRAFYAGLLAACAQFGGEIAGGDTVGSDRLVVNVTAVGECPPTHTPGRRIGAEVGDYIVATGFHGLSGIGLRVLQAGETGFDACKAAHLGPTPRIPEGLMLSKRFERYALMDSSDGLADALLKIAQASGKKLVVDAEKVPLHPEVSAYCADHKSDPWQAVLYGGEDFELVATVPEVDDALLAHFAVIGRVEAADGKPGAWVRPIGQDALQPLSLAETYQHFGVSHA